jgi:hypothetical protein
MTARAGVGQSRDHSSPLAGERRWPRGPTTADATTATSCAPPDRASHDWLRSIGSPFHSCDGADDGEHKPDRRNSRQQVLNRPLAHEISRLGPSTSTAPAGCRALPAPTAIGAQSSSRRPAVRPRPQADHRKTEPRVDVDVCASHPCRSWVARRSRGLGGPISAGSRASTFCHASSR